MLPTTFKESACGADSDRDNQSQIQAVDEEIARIEGLFGSPDFHRTHATQTRQLTADLAAAKDRLTQLYARWEELEAIKAAAERM